MAKEPKEGKSRSRWNKLREKEIREEVAAIKSRGSDARRWSQEEINEAVRNSIKPKKEKKRGKRIRKSKRNK